MTAYDDLGVRESIACVDRTWVAEAIRRSRQTATVRPTPTCMSSRCPPPGAST